MDNRKHNHIDAWDDGSYGTGNTSPPKSHSGIIALLLVLVIFLSGIVSILSFLNIRLFYELSEQQEQKSQFQAPVSFSDEKQPIDATQETIVIYADSSTMAIRYPTQSQSLEEENAALGMAGETVTRFDQNYFHVPQGLYLSYVDEDSDAFSQGIGPGDILMSINGKAITSQAELTQLVSGCQPGETVQAVFYRDGEEVTLTLTVGEIEN